MDTVTPADKARHPSAGRRSEATALATLRARVKAAATAERQLDDAIIEARAAGASLRAIGNVLGHSHVAIHARLRKLEENTPT